jgi:DegV family protein with EDD domain
MKKKVALITDSVASLPAEIKQRYDVTIMPLNISFNGKLYRDGVDLSPTEAYRMLQEKPEQFFASPASIGEYLNIFKATAETAEGILCITLSSRLSGMNNAARLAISQYLEDSPQVPVELLDSRNAAAGEGLIVSAAIEASISGKNLSEVSRIAQEVKDKVNVAAVLETIRYVYRTGRIPKMTARFGSFLNIRPLITIAEGRVKVTGLARDRESGVAGIIKQMKSNVQSRPVHIGIAHADDLEAGERLKEQLRSEFNCVELWLTDFSPVMAYATGTGVLLVAYYTDN